MQAESAGVTAEQHPETGGPSPVHPAGTPWTWRIAILAGILIIGFAAYGLRGIIGPRGQAFAGVFCFFGFVAMFSSNLRAVNWRTIGWGIALQIILAVLVLKVPFVNQALNAVKAVVVRFI